MRTIVAIHQPNFLPWLGYFFKIISSDIFCLLDDVQYSKNSYTNRCKILVQGVEHWLTIPVKKKIGTTIRDVEIASDIWRAKMFKTLYTNYSKSRYFDLVMDFLERELIKSDSLFELNFSLLKSLMKSLKVETKLILSSSYDIGSSRDDRLIDIVKACGGSVYLSGTGGGNYQCEEKFSSSNIELKYSEFFHPTYPQGQKKFVKGLSILDYLFNVGFDCFAQSLHFQRRYMHA